MPETGGTPKVRTDLAYYGVVTTVVGATQFVAAGLAGLGDGALVGYVAYVLAKANGTITAPHAEQPAVTAYASATGTFTHAAYTASLAVGDQLLFLHSRLADTLAIKTQTDKIPAIQTQTAGQLHSLDFWSASQEEVQLTDVAAPGTDVALPNVTVVDLPVGATIVRAIAMFKFRMVENTNAAINKLQGAQNIQLRDDSPGAWANAVAFVDDQFSLAATTRESGDVIIGAINISATVIGNDTYNVQWAASLVDAPNLQFNDVQVGLKIWYRV